MITAIVLGVWFTAALALCVGNHRWHRAAPTPEPVNFIPTLPPVPPSRRPLPESSPLDLAGFELDAAFFAVLAPSFKEYR